MNLETLNLDITIEEFVNTYQETIRRWDEQRISLKEKVIQIIQEYVIFGEE